ncbi:MAG TPA: 23S rRNA (uracil(1939)-C(5))-methyltransferase RlmD [Herpetosiphonaceae bacterium]
MHWPDELELELTAIAQGGDAVGRYEGRPVFASGGLPGEHVRVRLYDRQKAFARGRVIEVLRAAPERIASPCPLESVCGAADWRWIAPEAQRAFKRTILEEQLRHIGGLEVAAQPDEPPPDEGATWAYRTTAELHVSGARIGYFLPGSRRVSDIPACCLHHPLIDAALAALRPLLGDEAALRDLTLRCSPGSGEVIALLDGRGPLRELARRWRTAHPPLVGVVHATQRRALDGRDWIERVVGDTCFRLSASSFFQVNAYQTERLVRRVRTLLDTQPDTRLLDLYCGVGLFALSLAPEVAEVVGVEEWAPAIEDARRSAQLNRLSNVTFEVGAAERTIAKLAGGFDRVVLDPPRRGCAPEVLDAVIQRAPQRIVYVSCHPGTLARDCKQLAAAGYHIASAEVIDMFPHTHHVESIVRLERG